MEFRVNMGRLGLYGIGGRDPQEALLRACRLAFRYGDTVAPDTKAEVSLYDGTGVTWTLESQGLLEFLASNGATVVTAHRVEFPEE